MNENRVSHAVRRMAPVALSIAIGISGLGVGSASAATTHAVPSTIAANCSVDVTTALGNWLGSLPADAIAQLGSNACYRVDGTIQLRDRTGLTIEGNDATLQTTVTGSGDRAHLRFIGGSNLTLRRLTVRGANPNGGTPTAHNPDLQYQFGIEVRGVSGVNVDRVQVNDVYGDCLYLGIGYDGVTWTRNVVVKDSACRRNGRQGVTLTAAENVSITSTEFTQVGLMGVDIEPNGGIDGVKNVVIRNNTFGTSRQWFFAALGYSGGGVVDGLTIDGNTVTGKSLTLRVVPAVNQRWSNIVVTNNTSTTGEYYNGNGSVMDISRVDGLTVTGNTQPAAGTDQVFVSAADSCAMAVNSNTFSSGGALLRQTGTYSCGTTTTTTSPATTTTTTTPGTTAPIVSIAEPLAGQAVSGRVAVSASATASRTVVRMTVLIDGEVHATSETSSVSTEWMSTGQVSRGEHVVTVQAVDAAGNVGTSSVSVVR